MPGGGEISETRAGWRVIQHRLEPVGVGRVLRLVVLRPQIGIVSIDHLPNADAEFVTRVVKLHQTK